MTSEQMVKTITQQNQTIKEKGDLISKLVRLLADKTEEVESCHAYINELHGDEYVITFDLGCEFPQH